MDRTVTYMHPARCHGQMNSMGKGHRRVTHLVFLKNVVKTSSEAGFMTYFKNMIYNVDEVCILVEIQWAVHQIPFWVTNMILSKKPLNCKRN